MKKNSLATAIIAGVAGVAGLVGVAQAVNLNPDGLGQVLLYPYYTVNGGNSTLITVVNTTDKVKAVKVRFLEYANSAEVYDFNLYLSPYDVWATNVQPAGADPDDPAMPVTNDKSCTVPNVLPGTFLTYQFDTWDFDALFWKGDARTRQGYVEMIEMGVIDDSDPEGAKYAAAATHWNNSGVPGTVIGGARWDCARLEAAWDGGIWEANPNRYMLPPSGGLFGTGAIVNVERGRALSYNAVAIDGFYMMRDGTTLHTDPGSVLPDLSEAMTAPGIATARIFSNGNYHEISYPLGVDAVAAVLMSRFIYNEYNIAQGIGAASEWVITFPTKRVYTYFGAGNPINSNSTAMRPFIANFPVWFSGTDEEAFNAALAYRGSCHSYRFDYWDREERKVTRDLVPSPPPPVPGFSLCSEANVLAFGQTIGATSPTRILGATSAFGGSGLSGFAYPEGWARLELDQTAAGFQYYLPRATDDQVMIGQPVVGFWVSEVVNDNVGDGLRVNLGGLNPHRYSRDCRSTRTFPVSENAPGCPIP